MVHALIVLVPPGPSIHSAAYGSPRVEQRACISVRVCVCVCAEFKEKGYTFFGITSLMLDQFDCWCFLS